MHPHHEEHHLQRELTANKPDRVNAYRHTSAHGRFTSGATSPAHAAKSKASSKTCLRSSFTEAMATNINGAGFAFWTALAASCALTVALYLVAVWLLPKLGINL